jgi:hypothetical protein
MSFGAKALVALALGLAPAGVGAAATTGLQVLAATGTVAFNKKPVKVGDILDGAGVLSTGPDSSAKIFVRDAKTLALLKSNAAIEFTQSAKTSGSFRLLEGVSRWVVAKVARDKPVIVTTKTAVMGVRGTELMASYNEVLGETELVAFEGTVEFLRKDKVQVKSLVKAGQWGGIGGRFGEMSKIIDLPAPALAYFKAQSEVQTLLKDAVSDPAYHGHKVPK